MKYLHASIIIISFFVSISQSAFASEWCPGKPGSPTLNWSWTDSPTGCSASGGSFCAFSVPSSLPGSGSGSKPVSLSGPSDTCTATLSCNGGTVQSSDTLTWSNDKVWTSSCVTCTNGGCTAGVCNSGSRAGLSPLSGNDCPLAYSCTGSDPSNATMCSGDASGLSSNVAKSTVNSCTATKCEFTCNASYYANGSSCSLCSAGNYCPGASAPLNCPANSYCPGGSSSPTACPSGYISSAGATQLSDCTVAPSMNGWISAGASSCTISNGNDRCTVPFSWGVNLPESTSEIWRTPGNVQVSSGHSGSSVNFNVIYPASTFYLYNNSKLLSQDSANSDCQSSSAWNGSSCQACGNGGCTGHVCNNGASDAPTCTPPSYSCSGTAPSGSNFTQRGAVTGNGTWNYAASGECTWSCNSGYSQSGNTCTPTVYSCSGTAPSGGNFTQRGAVTGNGTWNYAASGECTWSCNSGYSQSGNTCVSGAVNGTCSSSLDSCTTGTFVDLSDNASNYRWYCAGSGGTDSPVCTYPKSYTVTFNGNGATGGSTDSQTFNANTGFNLSTNGFIRTGYTFNGWATSAGGSVSYGNGAWYVIGTADVTLYAVWTILTPPPSGSISVDSYSCVVPTGSATCSVNLTWSTTNPVTTSQVTANQPTAGTVIRNANSDTNYSVSVNPSWSGGVRYFLYNNSVELANTSPAVTATCAGRGYDTDSNTCRDPSVGSVTIAGNYYDNPADLVVTCNNSNAYEVTRGGTFVSGGAYPSTRHIPVTVAGNYSVVCKYGTVDSLPALIFYYTAPPAATVTLNATPRTITKDGSSILNWETKFPTNTCTLTAKVVCTNNLCTSDQNAWQTTISDRLATGNTDANDPNTQRSITTAVTTPAPGHKDVDWKGFGKKTITGIPFTTDFTLKCPTGQTETKRVQVTTSQEG